MGDWLVREILEYFVRLVLEPVPQLLVLVRELVLRVPEVTDQQPVVRLMGRSLGVVQVSYALVVAAAAIVAMGHGWLQGEYSARDVLQRAVIGFVAAHFTGWIVVQATRGTNAVIQALAPGGDESLARLDASRAMADQIAKAPESLLLLLVIQVVILVLLVLLIVGWVTRFLRLALLTGLGPLALACYGLPWLGQAAAAWWSSLLAVLVTVLAQAATLQFGLELLLDPGTDLTGVGTFDHSDVLTNMLLILCLLMAVIRMPTTVRRFLPVAGNAGGSRGGIVASVVRYTAMNRILRQGGGSRASGAGWPMRVLARRFARRQLGGHPFFAATGTGPTWTGIWRGAQHRMQPWPHWVGLSGAGIGMAASRVGAGRSLPGHEDLVQVRRDLRSQWSRRRARLAGRSVADPNVQPARVAGRTVGDQRVGAAGELQQRRSRAAMQARAGRFGPAAGPAAGRTASRTAGPSTGAVSGLTGRRPGAGPSAGGAARAGAVSGTARAAGMRRRGPAVGDRPLPGRTAGNPAALGGSGASRTPSPVTRTLWAQPGYATPSLRSVRTGQAPPPDVPAGERPAPAHRRLQPARPAPVRPARPARRPSPSD